MSVQKFAFLPKNIWSIDRDCFTLIWLCWYWDSGENKIETDYYNLNGEKLENKRYCRSSTNYW